MEPAEEPLGRKSLKRRTTRDAIALAALELFEEKGFAATSIDEITERAQVGRRTFFRYFPAKESVLLPDSEDYANALEKALEDQSLPLSMDKILDSFVAASGVLDADDQIRQRWTAVITDNELDIVSAAWRTFKELRDTAAEKIAKRTGLVLDDERLVLATNFGLFIVSMTVVRWSQSPATDAIEHEVARTLDNLTALLDGSETLG